MPYFVYKIESQHQQELIDSFPKYRDAKLKVRALRAENESQQGNFRLIFAKHPEEAVRLLSQKREPRPLGEDA